MEDWSDEQLLAATRPGAQPSLGTRAEVEALLG